MSRPHATVALIVLFIVFLIEMAGYIAQPYGGVNPIGKLVAAILVGVAIGLILNGFRGGAR